MAGETLDIWPLYLYHPGAVTVNFAIDRYASCVVEARRNSKIVLRSRDLGHEEVFATYNTLNSTERYRHPIPARIVRYFAPTSGVTITTHSEAPAGGRLLREEWAHRRKNAAGFSTPLIDRLVEPGARDRVAAAIECEGAEVLPVKVAPRGVQVRAVA
ncbi:MAG TPA: hypothetical protein VG096_04010 [Bryobacteraceae bacterium]|jgi:galactokinase/mevalonate kinase-like predicted kinase|nr:hypothetical protein [Bryobacteraceae bacterium]